MDMDQKLKAFVLMPFDPEFNAIYDTLIKASLEEVGYEVSRADSFLDQQNILRSIVRGITSADLILADLTTANANVFYELGLCHGLRIPTVLLAQSMDEIPFDLRSYKVQIYDTHFDRINKLRNSLKSIGEKHKQNEIVFGSPIIDFSMDMLTETFDASQETMVKASEDQEEEGLLDYLVGGEEASAELTSVLEKFRAEIEEITAKLNKHTSNMQGLGSNPGAGAAGRFHKISLLAASDINNFSKNVESTLPEFELAIDHLDENYSGWISLAQLRTDEDREQVVSLRATIKNLLEGSREANASTRSFRDSAIQLNKLRISKDLSRATRRQALVLDGVISNIDRVEAFCVKTIEVLDEKFA
jgi:hypothetical protein